MTPVYQTKFGTPHGNCFAAGVASLLERRIEDVDVDVASCNSFQLLKEHIQLRANCKIYRVSYEVILNRIVRTSEQYCLASVCSFMYGGNPHHDCSVWHIVVCRIENDGQVLLVFNPDKEDLRQKSIQEFPAVAELFFVKANPIM